MWENRAMRPTPRMVYAFIFIASTALILDAIFYMQDYLGLDPCPMCVLSRYTFTAIAIVALVAAIHGPRGMALKLYSSLVTLHALTGAGVSIRHSYLQHFPPATESCGFHLCDDVTGSYLEMVLKSSWSNWRDGWYYLATEDSLDNIHILSRPV